MSNKIKIQLTPKQFAAVVEALYEYGTICRDGFNKTTRDVGRQCYRTRESMFKQRQRFHEAEAKEILGATIGPAFFKDIVKGLAKDYILASINAEYDEIYYYRRYELDRGYNTVNIYTVNDHEVVFYANGDRDPYYYNAEGGEYDSSLADWLKEEFEAEYE